MKRRRAWRGLGESIPQRAATSETPSEIEGGTVWKKEVNDALAEREHGL